MAGWTTPATAVTETVIPSATWNATVRDNLNFLKANIGLEAAAELTIAAGVVTKTKAYHTIDTEADGSPDALDTINGGTVGDILFIRAEHTDRTVTVTDDGNIVLAGAADFSMDSTNDTMMLIYDGAKWLELSRSNNDA